MAGLVLPGRGESMRLIDADALCEVLDMKAAEYETIDECEAATIKHDMYLVQTMPIIDAVPVVRCKDCKHQDDGMIMWCYKHEKAVSVLDFCAQGERRCEDADD